MLKRALIYGGLVAVAGAILTFVMGAMGLESNQQASQFIGLLGFLFPIVGVVLAIRSAKNADPGPFSFGDGFKQGLLVALVAAVLGAVFTYLYVTAINPGYLDSMREAANAQLRQQGLGPRELQQMEAMQSGMTSPGAVTAIAFFSQLIAGAIISAVAAAIMRRKERPVDDGYGGQTAY